MQRYTIISVVNWAEYQGDNQLNDQPIANRQPTDDQPIATYKNNKKVKKDNNNKKTIYNISTSISPEVYKKILDDPTLANGDRDFLLRCCNEMKDWSVNNPPKLDWAAALRNWIRRAKTSNKPSSNGHKSKHDAILEKDNEFLNRLKQRNGL